MGFNASSAEFRHRIDLALVFVVAAWAVLAVVFGVTDLRISRAVADLSSPTAHFFERFGGFPGPAFIILGVLIYAANRAGSKKLRHILGRAFSVLVMTGASYYILAGILGFWNGIAGLTARTTIPVGLGLFAAWFLILKAVERWGRDFARRYEVVSKVILRVALFVALILIQVLKSTWGRTSFRSLGPDFAGYSPWYFPQGLNGDRSFPSGHVVMAWLTLSLVILCRYKPRAVRIGAWVLSLGWGFFIGYERIVSGAHYASDVLFGTAMTFIVFLLVYRKYGPPPPRELPAGTAGSRKA